MWFHPKGPINGMHDPINCLSRSLFAPTNPQSPGRSIDRAIDRIDLTTHIYVQIHTHKHKRTRGAEWLSSTSMVAVAVAMLSDDLFKGACMGWVR